MIEASREKQHMSSQISWSEWAAVYFKVIAYIKKEY
jgi:hypothetical protein